MDVQGLRRKGFQADNVYGGRKHHTEVCGQKRFYRARMCKAPNWMVTGIEQSNDIAHPFEVLIHRKLNETCAQVLGREKLRDAMDIERISTRGRPSNILARGSGSSDAMARTPTPVSVKREKEVNSIRECMEKLSETLGNLINRSGI